MTIELKVPHVGESIQEVQVGKWLKQPGDAVEMDEHVVELETDKASMEISAPSAGVLSKIVKREGDAVAVGEVIGYIDEGQTETRGDKQQAREASPQEKQSQDANASTRTETKSRPTPADGKPTDGKPTDGTDGQGSERSAGERTKAAAGDVNQQESPPAAQEHESRATNVPVTPAARRALREHGLTANEVKAEGNRLRPADVARHVAQQPPADPAAVDRSAGKPAPLPHAEKAKCHDLDEHDQVLEQVVKMSLIRRRIAQRLVAAQQTAALLTTFNEIDMSAVMQLRENHRARFQEKYGIKLGFMSFFVKAVIDGLKQFPELNAEIRGNDQIVYRNYYHIGIAVGGGQGLVVPVLRHAERQSFAEIELAIADFAERAQHRRLQPQELEGGTFTISNGGVYGSLLSTPIVNPPQSGVLGMHAIQERPVARDGIVVVRPMMYVALTYDHRIVDGQQAVTFLRRVKEAIEEPARMLIEV